MSTKDWPALPSEDDWRSDFEDAVMRSDEALSIRLRDTAAALDAVIAWAAPMKDAPKSARPQWFDDARAILTQLRTEGLI